MFGGDANVSINWRIEDRCIVGTKLQDMLGRGIVVTHARIRTEPTTHQIRSNVAVTFD